MFVVVQSTEKLHLKTLNSYFRLGNLLTSVWFLYSLFLYKKDFSMKTVHCEVCGSFRDGAFFFYMLLVVFEVTFRCCEHKAKKPFMFIVLGWRQKSETHQKIKTS